MIATFPKAINELASQFENKPPMFADKVYQKKLRFMTCKFSAEGHGTFMTNFLSFMSGDQVGQPYDFETDKDQLLAYKLLEVIQTDLEAQTMIELEKCLSEDFRSHAEKLFNRVGKTFFNTLVDQKLAQYEEVPRWNMD